MKKVIILLAILVNLVSCSTLTAPNLIVDYSDEGREKRRQEEERIAALKEARKKIKLNSDSEDAEAVSPTHSSVGILTMEKPKVDRDKCIRIVHISDLHSSIYGKEQENLIKKIKEAEPDLIVLTGNIFDFKTSYDRPIKHVRYLLQGIKGLAPIYYVSGNTEYYYYHENEFAYLVTDVGGKIIEEKAEVISLPLGKIIVSGIADPFFDLTPDERLKSKYSTKKYLERLEELKVKTEKVQAEAKAAGDKILFTLLLAHRPEFIEDYKKAACFDLILSGHTNGGLWRFGSVIKGLYAEGQGFFPKYAGGVYEFFDEEHPSAMVVSRGLSYQKLPTPRFGNNEPELGVIDIVPHESRF